MSYPRNFLRLAVSGTLTGGEGWAFGLALASETSTGTDPGPADVPPAITSAVETFLQAEASADLRMTTIKLNQIGQDGRYVSRSATVEHEYTTPWTPTGNPTFALPYQVTCAVSLLTDARRGPGHRGRFYLPVPRRLNDQIVSGLMTTGNPAAILASARTLVNNLNGAIPNHRVVVASKVGTGAMLPVTGLAVGNRPDIMRSRGNQLTETYSVAALTAG